MRTKTIARWRRAALAGALAVSLGEGAQQAPAQVQAPADQQPGVDAASASSPPEEQAAAEAGTPPQETPDLAVVSSKSRDGSNTVSVSGKLAFTPPPVVTVRASGLV